MIISTLAEGPQLSFDLATRIWWALSIYQSIGHPPFLHACVVDLTPNLLDTLTCRYYAPSSYLFCTLTFFSSMPSPASMKIIQFRRQRRGGGFVDSLVAYFKKWYWPIDCIRTIFVLCGQLHGQTRLPWRGLHNVATTSSYVGFPSKTLINSPHRSTIARKLDNRFMEIGCHNCW